MHACMQANARFREVYCVLIVLTYILPKSIKRRYVGFLGLRFPVFFAFLGLDNVQECAFVFVLVCVNAYAMSAYNMYVCMYRCMYAVFVYIYMCVYCISVFKRILQTNIRHANNHVQHGHQTSNNACEQQARTHTLYTNHTYTQRHINIQTQHTPVLFSLARPPLPFPGKRFAHDQFIHDVREGHF